MPVRSAEPDDGYARRFGGVARIYGAEGLLRLEAARVAVVGVGGVGSWVAEALARSAVGEITLIDLDHVAESNLNRQLQATGATLGMAKVTALAQRIADINPRCHVIEVEEFVETDNVEQLLPPGRFDYVIDAMDDGRAKVALILHAQHHRIPLVVVGSAGGQTDPSRVRVSDLAHTEHDPLLARVRKRLRTEHGFARNLKTRFGITAIYSDEPLTGAAGEGGGLNCSGYGSSVTVTAVFGFVAASVALNALVRPAPAL
jgi:tRNA A37 threonylcarbamoyladenosine dehydratase